MQKYFDNVTNRKGDAAPGALVTVKQGETLATIYSDDGVTVKSNPIVTDENGEFSFYAADGEYTLTVSGSGIDTRTIGNVSLYDWGSKVAEVAALRDSAAASESQALAYSVQVKDAIRDILPPTDSLAVGFQQAGEGAAPRTVQSKLRDAVSVFDFMTPEQIADVRAGTTLVDVTAAIQSAFDSFAPTTRKAIYFPSGVYLVSSEITFSGSMWDIFGDGKNSSIIKTTLNGAIFQIDLRAESSNRGAIRDLGYDRVFTLPYSGSCAIHVLTTPGVSGGLYRWEFRDLQMQHIYRFIRFGATAKEMWLGTPSIEKHSFCQFVNLTVLASTDYKPFECISFDEGCGPHHTIIGGNLFASGVGSSCIKVGDGGANNGFGDLIITGAHMTDAESGVKLVGPSGAGIYNQNVTIAGCQFDGPMTYTINATRMKNCRFMPNNSTSTGIISLVNCSNIAYQNEQNHFFLPAAISGHTGRLSNGVTFASTGQYSATDGYVMTKFEWSNDATGAIETVAKSRGVAPGSHVVAQVGDTIGQKRWAASDGVAFKIGAQESVRLASAPNIADPYAPMSWRIQTAPNTTTPPTDRIVADELGNVAIGTPSSTPTNATNGFVYLQKMLGAPTGVPATGYSGRIPCLIDEVNSRLWAHIGGAWKSVQFT